MKIDITQWPACLMVTILLAFTFSNSVSASDIDVKDRHELRRMQLQLAAAKQEKVELTARVEELQKQMEEMKSKSVVLGKKTGAGRKLITDLTEKIEETDKKLQELTLLHSETSQTLQKTQTEKDQERKRLDGEVQICEKKNTALYGLSIELIEKYRSKGVVASILQAEPFTQLERVRVDNLLQDYKEKAEGAKMVSSVKTEQITQQP